MTCKDCVHYGVCEYHCSEEIKGWDDTYDINDYCNHFQDKNKIIELPCKVGDKVYAYCDEIFYILEYEISSINISRSPHKKVIYQFEAFSFEEDELLDEIVFDNEDLGVWVFLSKADAENKLKGGKI